MYIDSPAEIGSYKLLHRHFGSTLVIFCPQGQDK
jgi:hypothetical protein